MTHVTREKPPSSSVMVGRAVATMVPSSDDITWASWTPTKTSSGLAVPSRRNPSEGLRRGRVLRRPIVVEGAITLRQGLLEPHLGDALDEGGEALLLGPQGAQLGAGPDAGPQPHDVHLPVHRPLVERRDVG